MLYISILDECAAIHDINDRYKIADWEKLEGVDYSTKFEGEEKNFFFFKMDLFEHMCYVVPIGTFTVHDTEQNFSTKVSFDGKKLTFLGKEVEYEEISDMREPPN